ncbi:aminotransferase [Novosphingobium endophyticum]|uniref:Aminotransferase n=1 Tax=Novosphingobium endophyticum TaxID=1955250 RepID=A0A916TWB4_9SPHN|nr:pyridoxal phosphate-dependent aminotransferase [Novosphingobium endophyticum]GGC14749.1 aminotransferase [Novosphingobium endophyticum]
MSVKLSERLTRLRPSPSMAAIDEIARLRREGHEILSLTVGEPDFPTPPHVIEAAVKALHDGETRYTSAAGIPALKRAICDTFRKGGLTYSEGEIALGAGAKQLIFSAFAATLDAGDEVVVPAPYWVSYPDIVDLFDARPVIVRCPAAAGFRLTPAALEAALTDRTRWLVINSPNNPTGVVYSAEELSAFGAVLARYPKCLVMSDEIYEHFVYDGHQFTSFAVANPELEDRVLTINGVSKAYAMTGFRLGYAGGPAWLAAAIRNLITQDTSCANSISQHAAVAALTGDQSSLAINRAQYEGRRDRLISGIGAVPGMRCLAPEGAFYVYASVAGLIGARTPAGETLQTDSDVASYFLREAKVATIAGPAYGLSPYLRLSFATTVEVIDRACAAIAAAAADLDGIAEGT